MPHGTMCPKCVRSVLTLNANPCMVTQRESLTPIAPILPRRACGPRSKRVSSARAWSNVVGCSSKTQVPTKPWTYPRRDAVVGREPDHHLREVAHVPAHVAAIRAEVDDGVGHELAGAVVGHVAAAARLGVVDAEPRARRLVDEHVRLFGAAAHRDHRVVLEEEHGVADGALEPGLEHAFLQVERRGVGAPAEPVKGKRRVHGHLPRPLAHARRRTSRPHEGPRHGSPRFQWAPPTRIELVTFGLGNRCSIH
jgi:hypothetical protein